MAPAKVGRNDPCPCGSGKKYKQCCARKPASRSAAPRSGTRAEAFLGRGAQLHRAGKLGEALAAYRQALEIDPRESRAMFGAGQALAQQGRLDPAIEMLRKSISIDRTDARRHVALADMLYMAGRSDEAITAAETALEVDRRTPMAHCVIAACLEQRREVDEALEAVGRALAISPDDLHARLLKARLLRRAKRLEEARSTIDEVLDASDLPPAARQRGMHERGIILDALDQTDEAFASVSEAGRIALTLPHARQFDRGHWARRLEQYRTGLTPERLGRARAIKVDESAPPSPAFLVGFPRSGTTMTEQALAAHPQVVSAEERPFIAATREFALRRAGVGDDLPAFLDALSTDLARDAQKFYWKQVEDWRGAPIEPTERFLDKLPLNIVEAPFIAAIFPNAKMLVALRDPRDVCLSCFMQDFRINSSMINFLSLSRSVEYYTEVMGLWLQVRGHLRAAHLEFRYEDTVVRFEEQIRRLLEFLELPWSDEVMRFHERVGERVISTPSFEAVAEPVHARAVGKWRRYESQFAELQESLQPFLDAFGYERGVG